MWIFHTYPLFNISAPSTFLLFREHFLFHKPKRITQQCRRIVSVAIFHGLFSTEDKWNDRRIFDGRPCVCLQPRVRVYYWFQLVGRIIRNQYNLNNGPCRTNICVPCGTQCFRRPWTHSHLRYCDRIVSVIVGHSSIKYPCIDMWHSWEVISFCVIDFNDSCSVIMLKISII